MEKLCTIQKLHTQALNKLHMCLLEVQVSTILIHKMLYIKITFRTRLSPKNSRVIQS